MNSVLYVYAVTRDPLLPAGEAVDRSRNFGSITRGAISAVYTQVSRDDFSQEAIDAHSRDVEWLGAVGYRHQTIVAELMEKTTIVPLRAFTLFSSDDALGAYLEENANMLGKMLERLDGKQEWTLRIEFDAQRWNEALTSRVASLRTLLSDIESAQPGKAFLLRKKLDDERKRASRDAELAVVGEIEGVVLSRLKCDTVAESRQQREGAFPQIDVLINRDEEAVLQELHRELSDRYSGEGIAIAMSGPWPPYTFASVTNA